MADTRSIRELNRATLARQALLEREHGPVADVIGRLAGLQAQHADPPYVALWSRRSKHAIADLKAALLDRSVVKATVMRSTLHLVAATDYPAYDAATAEARVANWRATARRAGVDLDTLHASLLEYCDEPRTVAEIEQWIEKRAPGLAAAAPAGVRNTASRGDDAVLRLEPFAKLSAVDRRALADEGESLVRFHEPAARRHEVVWAD